MALIRRLLIIAIVFSIILFIKTIQLENITDANPRTLVALGFVILASFTLGEIFSFMKLPRVIGYLVIGIIFGPYLAGFVHLNYLKVLSSDVLKQLELVNTVTLSVIALTAGLELKISGIKNSIKSISMILLMKILVIFVVIPLSIFALAPFIPFLRDAGSGAILATGLLLSVIALGTSIELTLVVADESKAKGKFIDLILSTAIVKDVIVILLLAICLTLATILMNPSAVFDIHIFTELGLELALSVFVGALLGLTLIAYLKYVAKELLLFVLAFIIIASYISILLHLEILLLFIAAGFVVQNFSEYGEKIHLPLQKLALPIFITFFTVAGASIDLNSVIDYLLVAFIFVLVRSAALYLSVKYATRITKEAEPFPSYGWMGFVSIGGLMLGLAVLIEEKLPGIGSDLKVIITSIVALNIFLGPILLKFALGKVKSGVPETTEADQSEDAANRKQVEVSEKDYSSKFIEPNLANQKLNRSLFQIHYKLNDVLKEFDRKFIYQRSEESLELVISVNEKYTDDYLTIKSILNKEQVSNDRIQQQLLSLKKELSDWYLELASERRSVEKNILKLEDLINNLFISLVDLTDGLQQNFVVDLEDKFLEYSDSDTATDKFYKRYYKLRLKVSKLFNKEFKLIRSIDYRNIAKYYLVGLSASEILETVNLVGAERLTTLKKVKRLFNDYLSYLDELIILSNKEKNNPDLKNIVLDKLAKLHEIFTTEINIYRLEINNTTTEISTRLTYALANPYNQMVETLGIAGTYLFDSKSIKYSKIFSKSEKQKDLTSETIRYWVNFYHGFIGMIEKDAYLNKIKSQLTSLVNSSLINVSEEINKHLREVCVRLVEEIKLFRTSVKNISTNDELQNLMATSSGSLFVNQIQHYTRHLEEIKKSKRLNSLLEFLIVNFNDVVDKLPAEIIILEDSDFKFTNRVPQFIELKHVQLQKITKSILEHKLPREIGEINELLVNHLNITLQELKNLYSIVTYHIKTAENEIETDKQMSSKIAFEMVTALNDKLEHRINQLISQIDKLELNINSKILDKVNNSIELLEKYMSDNSVLKSNLYITQQIRRNKVNLYLNEVLESVNYYFRKNTLLTKRFFRRYLKIYLTQFTNRFKVMPSTSLNLISESYILNEDRLKKLPFLYRKLFDGTTIESSDFFVKNDMLEKKILKVLDNFNKGKYSATILIGEPGSGKSTLVNSIVKNYLSNSVVKSYKIESTITSEEHILNLISSILGYPHGLKLEELLLVLNDKTNKQIIVLENIGKLFFKKIGGYDAIKLFTYIVSFTSKNILWLCTIGKHPWTFINNGFEVEKVFMNKIFISELHRNDVRNIILNRHNSTGYDLYFKPDEFWELKSKIFKQKSKSEEQKILSQHFFNKLEEYCEGNIISGMYYWLQSITEIQENALIIKPVRKLQLSVLSSLDDIYMLSISEILTHDSLTGKEHSQLFDLPLEESREILIYLSSLNILNVDQTEFLSNRYYVNKFIYKIIEKELFKRNMF